MRNFWARGTPDDSLQFSSHIADNGKKIFDTMCVGGHEGVIAKRADGRYVGDRTASWLKIKCTKRQEFVVGGYRPSDTGRGMASLILGTYENGKLIYRGRVGTGFTEAMRRSILAQLEKRLIDKPAFASVPRDGRASCLIRKEERPPQPDTPVGRPRPFRHTIPPTAFLQAHRAIPAGTWLRSFREAGSNCISKQIAQRT